MLAYIRFKIGCSESSTQKLITKYSTEEKNKHVICRPRSVRIGKNCALSLECGLGPYSKPLAQYFPIRTSWPANNIWKNNNIVKKAKGSERMHISVFIYVCNVFFPGQVTITSTNT